MPTDYSDPQSYLPLTPPLFHVLLALADGDKHGYAIMKEVAERTNNGVQLSTGTLYGIIKRLIDDGLIQEPIRRPSPADDDDRRRYYRLTTFGRQVAIAETQRLEGLIATAHAKKLVRRPRTV